MKWITTGPNGQITAYWAIPTGGDESDNATVQLMFASGGQGVLIPEQPETEPIFDKAREAFLPPNRGRTKFDPSGRYGFNSKGVKLLDDATVAAAAWATAAQSTGLAQVQGGDLMGYINALPGLARPFLDALGVGGDKGGGGGGSGGGAAPAPAPAPDGPSLVEVGVALGLGLGAWFLLKGRR